MKKHYLFSIIFTLLFLNTFSSFGQSKNTLALGFNITHFSDWDKQPLNFFNPEIIYLKEIKNNKGYSISIDGFYNAYSVRGRLGKDGDIIDRLIFSVKGNYLYKVNNTIVGMGTNVRYRSEKKFYFYPGAAPFDAAIERNGFLDFGLNANLQQQLIATKGNKIFIKLNYSLYNKGRNPLSLGLFYGWNW